MKLYHGTSAPAAMSILQRGLLPDAELDPRTADQDWYGCGGGDPCLVYLTGCYAGSFADRASNSFTHPWALVEIDAMALDPARLLPDMRWTREWVEAVQHDRDGPRARLDHDVVGDIHRGFCSVGGLWRPSLDQLGMCAHDGPVALSAISRVSLYEAIADPASELVLYDSTWFSFGEHPLNAIVGSLFTRWCFHPLDGWDLLGAVTALLEQDQVELAREIVRWDHRDRSSLTVLENPTYVGSLER